MVISRWSSAAMFLVLGLSTVPATAAVTNWTNAGDGAFNNSLNWDNGVPTSSLTAQFNDSLPHVVAFSANESSQGFGVAPSTTATLDLGAGNSLNVSTGAVIIDGTLSVTNLGSMTAQNNGGDSIDLNANGSLKVLSGATLTYGGSVPQTGIQLNGAGASILVDGAGSLLDGSGAYVDRVGYVPTITISNGGVWKAPSLYGSSGLITVTGANSKFINAPTSPYGVDLSSGAGSSITVQDGGSWSSGFVFIGINGPPSTVTVGGTGAAATMEATRLLLQSSTGWANAMGSIKSNGTLRITAGTGVDLIVPGGYANSSSTLTLEGGLIEIASGSTFEVGGNVYGGGFTSGGTFRGAGTIQRLGASGSFALTNIGGEVRPGDTTVTPAVGTMAVTNGSFTQTAGTLYLDFTSGDSADLIAITGGSASLAGTLNFSILGGYTPQLGDIWDFIRADTVSIDSGTFAAAYADVLSELSAAGYVGPTSFGVVSEGGQQVLQLALPEPASAVLLMTGALLVTVRRRARR